MKIKDTTKGSWYAFIVIIMCITLGVLMNSCESQSGKLCAPEWEHVVVLKSSYPVYYDLQYTEGYKYTLLRYEYQNIQTNVYNPNKWSIGDTIMLKFTKP